MAAPSGYRYRRTITLDGTTTVSTAYAVKLTITISGADTVTSFSLGGHCTNFPQDIYFCDDDASYTALPFWIESSDGTTAIVWVKMHAALAGGDTFYCYYGKASGVGTSIKDTFTKGDDFEWGSDPTSIAGAHNVTWVIAAGAAVLDDAVKFGGVNSALIGGAGVSSNAYFSQALSASVSLRMRICLSSDAISGTLFPAWGDATYSTWVYSSGVNLYYYDTAGHDTGLDFVADGTTFNLLEINNINLGTTPYTYDLYLNSVLAGTYNMRTYNGYSLISIRNTDTTAGHNLWIDDIIVRPWQATEPVFSSAALEVGIIEIDGSSTAEVDELVYKEIDGL